MPAAIGETNQAPQDLQDAAARPIDPPADVPAWLAARRERPAESVALPEEKLPASQPSVSPPPPALSTSRRKVSKPIITVDAEPTEVPSTMEGWVKRWISNQGMIGIGVSLLVHALVLLILACFLVGQVRKVEEVSLWGTAGNSDEVGDTTIETELPGDIDAGESAPLQMTSVSESLDSIGPHGTIAESMRVGGLGGGNGHGQGVSGDGNGMGVAGPKVPGHAQTKGSFSAWPDPRDPKPGEDYFIVIQIRLPKNITKYRGSDVSGNVIGTDGYRQAIRFKPNETIDVEDGAVQMRIFVPGGGRLIRDTIRVESKILKEKQTFEIEF